MKKIYEDQQLTCFDCGSTFIFSGEEQKRFDRLNYVPPKRCKACREKRRKARKAEEARIQAEKKKSEQVRWEKQKATEKRLFEQKIQNFNTAVVSDISVDPAKTLYIIGNGFDRMHDVPSSYYDFNKTIGKNSPLRFALETYLNVEDLWADFEEALGHLNVGMMLDPNILDMWLDNFNAYDPDAQAADFFLAVDTATGPASTITSDLPRRFRMWVESLICDTEKRPLQGLVQDGKVLCFNYTEFIENLYGVSESHVCYIHGCRRKKKFHPKEKLILGHRPGAGEEEWDVDVRTPRFKDPYKRYVFEAAVDTASRQLGWYDDETTKNSLNIIKDHQEFFEGLKEIETAVVIGHSLSPVDWDYFREIKHKAKISHWYVTCYGYRDLQSLKRFISAMGIHKDRITVIRLI